ncbi:glycosyltransferase family 9 protein [Alteromonas australica]|nr:glycosyltransferase family 9 protein [Alteromonas australica]
MASGLPSSIKHVMPNAKVTWLVEPAYAEMMRHHSQVDDVISWPKNEWRNLAKKKRYFSLLKAILHFRQTLKSHGFTHAIDAQGLLKSAFLAWLSGAEKRIGFISKEHSHVLLTDPIQKPVSNEISSEYRALATFIGASHYALDMQVSQAVDNDALAKLGVLNVTQPYIVLAPFTTRPQKHWPVGHWQRLIKEIRKMTPWPMVILGGPGDECDAQAFSFTADNVHTLAGHASLAESIALVAHSALVVGVDTGLTHMGTAYNKPTIAMFGSTCPYTKTDNPDTHVIYKDLSCAPCKRKPICAGTYDCMWEISPEDITAIIRKYL